MVGASAGSSIRSAMSGRSASPSEPGREYGWRAKTSAEQHYVAKSGNKGWSLYGAPWLQPVATGRKSAGPQKALNKPKLSPSVATARRVEHGKEGVDGSSPSEGLKSPQIGMFCC